jgi:hypothetical protein
VLGFSFEYIDDSLKDPHDYGRVMENVRRCGLFGDDTWKSFDIKNLPGDSVKKILKQSLEIIGNKTGKNKTCKSELLKGMILHYLHEYGVESAFDRADTIFRNIALGYPERIEGPWYHAIHLIKGGKPFTGIKILDRMRLSRDIQSRHFWSDYVLYSFLAFMPNREKFNSSIMLEVRNRQTKSDSQSKRDKTMPSIKTWKVISETNKKGTLP